MKKTKIVAMFIVASMVIGLMGCSGKSSGSVNPSQITTVTKSVEKILDADGFDDKSVEEKADLVKEELFKLADEQIVKKDSIIVDQDSKTISYEFMDGGQGGVILEMPGDPDPEASEVAASTEPSVVEEVLEKTEYPTEYVEEVGKTPATDVIIPGSTPTDTKVIDAGDVKSEQIVEQVVEQDEEQDEEPDPTVPSEDRMNVLILDAFESDRDGAYNYISGLFGGESFENISGYVDLTVEVEDLLTFADYDFVSLSMHGTNLYNYKYNEQQAVIVLLDAEADASTNKKYDSFLANGEIAVVSGRVTNEDGSSYTSSFYAVYPSFFANHYEPGSLCNTTIFSESCEFFGWCEKGVCNVDADIVCSNVLNDFGSAFYAAGSPSVVGFHNSVMAEYALNFMLNYMVGIQNQYTPREVFAACVYELGSTDIASRSGIYAEKYPAYPIIMGNELDHVHVRVEDSSEEEIVEETVEDLAGVTEGDMEFLQVVFKICVEHGKVNYRYEEENRFVEVRSDSPGLDDCGGYDYINPQMWVDMCGNVDYYNLDVTDTWTNQVSDVIESENGQSYKVKEVLMSAASDYSGSHSDRVICLVVKNYTSEEGFSSKNDDHISEVDVRPEDNIYVDFVICAEHGKVVSSTICISMFEWIPEYYFEEHQHLEGYDYINPQMWIDMYDDGEDYRLDVTDTWINQVSDVIKPEDCHSIKVNRVSMEVIHHDGDGFYHEDGGFMQLFIRGSILPTE